MKQQDAMSHRNLLRSYVAGFLLSLTLTIAAYLCVANKLLAGRMVLVTIIVLAIVQLAVQLVFFLHIDRESKPRWQLMVLLFMAMVLGIITFGSLWIMHNLDYNMSSHDMSNYLQEDEGYQRD